MSDDQRYHADKGKPRWLLVPVRAMRLVVAVFEFGAKKYAARSYLDVPNGIERYVNSTCRHVEAVKEAVQEDGPAAVLASDEETGLPHLAHAIADALILIDIALHERAKGGAHAELRR